MNDKYVSETRVLALEEELKTLILRFDKFVEECEKRLSEKEQAFFTALGEQRAEIKRLRDNLQKERNDRLSRRKKAIEQFKSE